MNVADNPGPATGPQVRPPNRETEVAEFADAASRTSADNLVLPEVQEYLIRGLALRRWWEEIEKKGGPRNTFPIERSFNRPTRSFGFFDDVEVQGKMLPVLGDVQEMFYDQVRAPAGHEHSKLTLAQMREFVMKYLLRITSFPQPKAYSDASSPAPPPAFTHLSWCPAPAIVRSGFGFTQLFNKPAGSDAVQAFPSYERNAIVDQRLIGPVYDWIVLKVRIFDFVFKFRPFGPHGPELVFSENEESSLVVQEEFINHKDYSETSSAPVRVPSAIGEYGAGHYRPIADCGIGYAFIKNPIQSAFGFGPGEFDAAIQLINFRIYETGYISVRMVFIANRLRQVSNIAIDPVSWSFKMADAFSFGLASRVFAPVREILDQAQLRTQVDPVSSYISLANLISGGDAARSLCISKETLEKAALLIHFQQHYQTILSTLSTWRQFDWLNPASLPPWVVSGING
jgi:hypothetical protein